MNNLQTSQTNLELTIRESKISQSIAVAFQRTGTDPYNIEMMVNDIKTEFKFLSDDEIQKAIRNGGLGKYGKTYKLTTQEVCIWIREYLKERNKNRSI